MDALISKEGYEKLSKEDIEFYESLEKTLEEVKQGKCVRVADDASLEEIHRALME